jgi:hypothetical protein
MPVEVTAWYHKPEPIFVDCLALVRRHRWRAWYVVTAAADPEFVPFPRTAFKRWLTGLPLAACWAKAALERTTGVTSYRH